MFFREDHTKEITWIAKGYWDYVAQQGTDFQKKYLLAIREYSDSMKDAVIYELPLDYLVDKLDILDSRDLLRAARKMADNAGFYSMITLENEVATILKINHEGRIDENRAPLRVLLDLVNMAGVETSASVDNKIIRITFYQR